MYVICISVQTEMHYLFCLFCVTSSPFTNFCSVILYIWGKKKTAIVTWCLFILYCCIHFTGWLL